MSTDAGRRGRSRRPPTCPSSPIRVCPRRSPSIRPRRATVSTTSFTSARVTRASRLIPAPPSPPISELHSDSHASAFAPGATAADPPVVFCGTDGGAMQSVDRGQNWTSLNGHGVQTELFYNVDGKPDATSSSMMGTLQDNGILRGTGPGPWTRTCGGDGWDVVYDIGTNDRAYAASNGGVSSPPTTARRGAGSRCRGAGPTLPPTTSTRSRSTPSNTGVVYITGAQNLWQSQDATATWSNIFSPGRSGGGGRAEQRQLRRGNRRLVGCSSPRTPSPRRE